MSLYAFTPQQSYCFKILKLALFWHPDNETCNPATSSAMTNSSVRLFDYSPRKRRYAAQVKAEERRTRHHHSSSRAILRRSVLRGRLRAKKRPKTSLISSLPYTTTENDAAAAWLAMTKVSREEAPAHFQMVNDGDYSLSQECVNLQPKLGFPSLFLAKTAFSFWLLESEQGKEGRCKSFLTAFFKSPPFFVGKRGTDALVSERQKRKE